MDIDTTYKRWHTLARLAGFKMDEGGYDRPFDVGGVETPRDLTDLTIGQLVGLGSLQESDDSVYAICDIVLGLGRHGVDGARAVDVVRFIGWVTREVARINRLFEGIQERPTPQEIKAGVNDLRFGLFGLLDWYAKRMGIASHDDVLPVPWVRVYKCMEMDCRQKKYERRYSEVMSDEYRRKS